MLKVLIVYYENELFLMLRVSPHAYRHLQDITFCFTRSAVVQLALLLRILHTFSNPRLDCCIAQNLSFVTVTWQCNRQ